MAGRRQASRFIWSGVIVLAVSGFAAATRRALVLFWPGVFAGKYPPAAALDAGFARHMSLTLVHIIPGALFLVLALLQFVPNIRNKHLRIHRWLGKVLVVSGLVIGISALVMSFTMNIGGPNETAATTLFGILFLFCLIKGYRHIRRKEVAKHREWMIRAYGIGLGVATTRPIVGMFFAFRKLTPHEFFGIAFWLGFTITFLSAEAWIDYTREHGIQAQAFGESIHDGG
ncbi:MAG: putative rane protein [Candidatus Sulfotelmatobacter sp.]|nr:putative rane protein [Candidatus Sulfotelmatobacter sp.]